MQWPILAEQSGLERVIWNLIMGLETWTRGNFAHFSQDDILYFPPSFHMSAEKNLIQSLTFNRQGHVHIWPLRDSVLRSHLAKYLAFGTESFGDLFTWTTKVDFFPFLQTHLSFTSCNSKRVVPLGTFGWRTKQPAPNLVCLDLSFLAFLPVEKLNSTIYDSNSQDW